MPVKKRPKPAALNRKTLRMGREKEIVFARTKRYLMVKRILAVFPSLTTLMT
jgi:hypothetical protein